MSGQAIVMTPFGPAIINGPFAQDYTSLKWQFRELQDGEVATFSVCGLKAWVRDCDGDRSIWELRKGRTVVAHGEDEGFEPPHFWACLRDAEAALRGELARRVEELRTRRALRP